MTQHYQGHRERLRERLKISPESVADYELLELVLGHVLLRRDTKPLAKEMLARFQSLTGLLEARPEEISAIPGAGPGVAAFLGLLHELFARQAEGPIRMREILCTPQAVALTARRRLGTLRHEEVWAAYVDSQNRLIEWGKAFTGTVDGSTVYPREIIERGLTLKAAGFFLVHNHPGGNTSPSTPDLTITERLREAAQLMDMRLIDHLIVTADKCYSLMMNGFI